MTKYFLFLLPFLSFCIYESEEENFILIEKPQIEDIIIEVSETSDTIELTQSSQLVIDISDKKNKNTIKEINITLNNVDYHKWTQNENKITITLDPSLDNEYFQFLTVEVTLQSNSGSLIDQLETELSVFKSSWVIHFNGAVPSPSTLIGPEFEDGIVTVRWNEPDRSNFENYQLKVNYEDKNNRYTDIMENYYFEKEDDLFFQDSTFINGTVTYTLIINGERSVYGSPLVYKNDYSLNLKYEILEDKRLKIIWDPIPFYNQKAQLQLYIDEALIPINDLTSTEYVTEKTADLLNPINVNVELIPVGLKGWTPFKEQLVIDSMPNRLSVISSISSMAYDKISNSFFVIDRNHNYDLFKYDGTTYELIEQRPTNDLLSWGGGKIYISENGEHAYLFSASKRIIKFDTETLELTDYGEAKDIVGFENVYFHHGKFNVANNNLAILELAEPPNKALEYFIIDLTTKSILAHDLTHMFHLSFEGNYAYHNTDILKYDGTGWSVYYSTNEPVKRAHLFKKDDINYLVTLSSDNSYVYDWTNDLTQGSILTPTTISETNFLQVWNYDPKSNLFYCSRSSARYLYDFTDFTLKYSSGYYLNNTFFSSSGGYLYEKFD